MTKTQSLLVATACLMLLASCSGISTDRSILQEQARTYVAAHPNIERDIAQAIASNRLRRGMTIEQVMAAWGEPVEIQKYRDGMEQYWYFGCGWPHHCVGPDIGMSTVEQYQSRALFINGKLVDWQN